jgi:hypothetical protein
MSQEQRDLWNARVPSVTTQEHCDSCGQLREGVEKREHSQYWPSFSISLKSCAPCFEAAKVKARAEAQESYSGVVCC